MSEPRVQAAVWVTRPEPRNAVTARVLRAGGLSVVAVPVLAVTPVALDPVPAEPPDWVVFVSANAVDGLEAALAAPGFSAEAKEKVQAAAVGRKTAAHAQSMGWRVCAVPERETAQGLLEAFSRCELAGRRVWIPAGSRKGSAATLLPEALRAAGAGVEVFRVYETRERELSSDDIRALVAAVPGALVVHSPSAAEAVFASQRPEVERWREGATPVSIGPSTTARLRELGAGGMLECPRPGDADLRAVLETLF